MPSATAAQQGDNRWVMDAGRRAAVDSATDTGADGGTGALPSSRADGAAAERAARGLKAVLVGYRQLAFDVAAVAVAALDVWLRVIPEAEPYNYVLSVIAVIAVALRRKFPFLVVLVTVPGFLAGWAQLAAMIALGTLARRRLLALPTVVGAVLVWLSRFFVWPVEEFLAQEWKSHVHNAIYGCIVAGMPIAIALLAHAREQLSARIAELAASRERERVLHAHAVRADERARLAREMHDVVSHQVSLIAMQAGALRVVAADPNAKQVAGTIRALSTRTLDELRQLVSVLRTTSGDDAPQPRIEDLPQLVATSAVPASLTVRGPVGRAPAPVSGAVYRTVQEALTNVRKHAHGAAAAVLVDAEGDRVRVEVRNERPDPCPSQRPEPALPGGGHGLVGLRERAVLLDGEFHAGPTDDGGFLVRVALPLAR
ncbi:signal transduction histidine kinase [Saccharothrix coeruleofusca]|uniref:sensor histidine kinase n=1 Tax=Saccharothrix coeruleofusca TaxID=33919 RepID=UPI001AE463BB|nr:histidine kinase [Saccharothrix coeruleofusca]MBP2337785.1 signal transduction histidine kinase [Saccharothrix coeruleofusca]